MKYRIVEECDDTGKPFTWTLQFKMLFFWAHGGIGFTSLEVAKEYLSKLNGSKRIIS